MKPAQIGYHALNGDSAYGWLKPKVVCIGWCGFRPDSSARRHTSFASVWIYPVHETIEVEIEEKDLRIDTIGPQAGGQHVNKTDSAIRITHLPTNIVVRVGNDRSQHRNRATAFNMLRHGFMSNCSGVKPKPVPGGQQDRDRLG